MLSSMQPRVRALDVIYLSTYRTTQFCLLVFQCRKCRGIKELNMPITCSCAGQFRTLTGCDDLSQLVKTFRGIALHYKMQLLLEVVQWTMTMNGWATEDDGGEQARS